MADFSAFSVGILCAFKQWVPYSRALVTRVVFLLGIEKFEQMSKVWGHRFTINESSHAISIGRAGWR